MTIPAGYTTTLMVVLLIGSTIMMSLGVIGYYIAKIYEEVKRRPRYIVSKIVRGKEDVSHEANHDTK
jgi:dolichol-phosphate mannosyltransferase